MNIFPYGIIEIRSMETKNFFKVNDHRLKPFIKNFDVSNVEKIRLVDPINQDD